MNKKTTRSLIITLRISPEDKKILEKKAEETCRTLSGMAHYLIREGLERGNK